MKLDLSKVPIDNSAAINAGIESIQNAVNEARKGARAAIDQMRQVGALLIQQKKSVKHGEWEKWLETKCPKLTLRMAQRWMESAFKNDTVEDSTREDNSTMSFLTTDEGRAIGLLSEPVAPNASAGSVGNKSPANGLTFLQKASEWFNSHAIPATTTPDQEASLRQAKKIFIQQSQPIVDLHNRLLKELS